VNGTLAVAGLPAPVTELSGAVSVGRDSVSSESLGGRFLGEPVSFRLENAADDLDGYRVIARATGIATARGLVEELGVPMQDQLGGATAYQVDILFPDAKADEPAPLSVRILSDLAGLTVDLPEPFTKPAAERIALVSRLDFLPGQEGIENRGSLGDDIRWLLRFAAEDGVWDFDRGELRLGSATPAMPGVRGLHIVGSTPEVRFADWLALGRNREDRFGLAERVRSVELSIDSLYIIGQRLDNHTVEVDRSARDWVVQVDGTEVVGSLLVPYQFGDDRPIVLDMERLVLPGDDTASGQTDGADIDPRLLPPVSLTAREFAIGNRHFGNVVAEFEKTSEGLYTSNVVATDPTFEIIGTAGWVAKETDPRGSESYVTVTLASSDVVETMRRLDYSLGIESDDMRILLDLAWSGGPRLDFLESLNGEVQVRLGSGQLVEVEPGAGRVFGLMSIVALPRRLSLDFRDVFDKGFGFDEIAGSFNIIDGVATTCNLGFAGPAAEIAIIGSVDLVGKEYDQAAVVAANFGDSLPIIGLIGGPQTAAALLIFSQVFKKPLQEAGQIFYGVTGSWDEPSIDSTSSDAFAERARLSGCVAESG
jgi:uncharacterized protein YhdP